MSSTALKINQIGSGSQFQGHISQTWQVSVQTTPGAITTGINAEEVITVPGVALGDMVVMISSSADLAAIVLYACVSAANTVDVLFANNTAGTITPTAGATIKMLIVRPAW